LFFGAALVAAFFVESGPCFSQYTGAMQVLSISRRLVDKFPPEAFTPELIAGDTDRGFH